MRYTSNHKERSRERILDVAAKQFRAKGSDAVRVVDVMKAAGLTHGGFYKHFTGKDELLIEAVQTALAQLAAQLKALAANLSRTEALRVVIATYLSEDHVRNPNLGCAFAALGSEMARMPADMKLAISASLDAYADQLSFLMPGETANQRRAGFLVLFPSMAGCIMMARASSSKDQQRQILAAGRTFFEQAFCNDQSPAFLEAAQ